MPQGWPKGKPRGRGTGNAGKGRVKGVPNKRTQTVNEAFDYAFEKNGGKKWLATWAKENPTEFMRIFGRRVTQEVGVTVTGSVTHNLPPSLEEKLIAVYGDPDRA